MRRERREARPSRWNVRATPSAPSAVVLPLPFGPISAWISPARRSRSSPRRISRPPSVTCRSRASSPPRVGSAARRRRRLRTAVAASARGAARPRRAARAVSTAPAAGSSSADAARGTATITSTPSSGCRRRRERRREQLQREQRGDVGGRRDAEQHRDARSRRGRRRARQREQRRPPLCDRYAQRARQLRVVAGGDRVEPGRRRVATGRRSTQASDDQHARRRPRARRGVSVSVTPNGVSTRSSAGRVRPCAPPDKAREAEQDGVGEPRQRPRRQRHERRLGARHERAGQRARHGAERDRRAAPRRRSAARPAPAAARRRRRRPRTRSAPAPASRPASPPARSPRTATSR